MTFAEKIHDLRTKKGMTQKELADKLGNSHKTVSHWEKGRQLPPGDALAAIAAALDVTPGYLTGEQSELDAGYTICEIPIERIKPNPANFYSMSEIESLAASIEEHGLLHNLVVRVPDKDGNYEIVSGERRYRACMMLRDSDENQYKTIPCKIDADGTELKLIYSNATARVLSDYELTKQAARTKSLMIQMRSEGHKFKGRMRDIVAEMLSVSSAQIGRMERISNNLLPEFMAEFKAGRIGITAAYDLSNLDVQEQNAAYSLYQETGDYKPPASVEEASRPQDAPEAAGDETPSKPQDKQDGRNAPPPTAPTIKARVTLVDEKSHITYSGNLVIIAAVDAETDQFDGVISADDRVTGLDYATLAKVVCDECLKRLEGDKGNIEIMRGNLAMLFENGFEG